MSLGLDSPQICCTYTSLHSEASEARVRPAKEAAVTISLESFWGCTVCDFFVLAQQDPRGSSLRGLGVHCAKQADFPKAFARGARGSQPVLQRGRSSVLCLRQPSKYSLITGSWNPFLPPQGSRLEKRGLRKCGDVLWWSPSAGTESEVTKEPHCHSSWLSTSFWAAGPA